MGAMSGRMLINPHAMASAIAKQFPNKFDDHEPRHRHAANWVAS